MGLKKAIYGDLQNSAEFFVFYLSNTVYQFVLCSVEEIKIILLATVSIVQSHWG